MIHNLMCVLGELHFQPPVKTDQLLNSLLFSYFLRKIMGISLCPLSGWVTWNLSRIGEMGKKFNLLKNG